MPPTSLGRRFLTNDRGVIERFGDPFQPLEPECRVIQFDERLTPEQLRQAGDLIADRPEIELYVYAGVWRDLSFLKYFPTLRRLHIALYKLDDISGFADVLELRELTFGETEKKFSLSFVAAWPQLKRLFLVRHKTDLPRIRALGELEDLGLSGYTLPDMSLFLAFPKLRRLQLLLGGTRDLAELARLRQLDELWLMRITRLTDLGVLADLAGLKRLKLDWMRNVTSLPSLERLERLEDVTLDTMKGLTDLSPIAAAPALRRLAIGGMPHLAADSFRCLVGHPRLAELYLETGKRRLDEQIIEMLPGVARHWSQIGAG
jgi:hypothetical protein